MTKTGPIKDLGEHIVEAIFATDDSTTECDLRISSNVDWPTDVRIYRHHCGRSCGNTNTLASHNVISNHGRNVYMQFDSMDDVVRLALGHSTDCDRCNFNLPDDGHAAVEALSDPENHGRHITLNGTRRTVIRDSASVIFTDVTGKDHDCVSAAVTAKDTLLSDLKDKLEKC